MRPKPARIALGVGTTTGACAAGATATVPGGGAVTTGAGATTTGAGAGVTGSDVAHAASNVIPMIERAIANLVIEPPVRQLQEVASAIPRDRVSSRSGDRRVRSFPMAAPAETD